MAYNSDEHFSLAPEAKIPRSRFDRSSSVKLTFNVGELIPFYLDEVYPGDTFDISTSKLVRMQTPVVPLMDDLYLDTFYFFVPARLTWSHWKEFMGENTSGAWIPTTSYTIPQLKSQDILPGPLRTPFTGSLADYLGWFSYSDGYVEQSVSALPFRAYALICNEWFRDENLQQPLNIPLGDSDQIVAGDPRTWNSDHSVITGTSDTDGTAYINDVANGGLPFIACKLHDYFSSCLPSPAKISTGSVQMLLQSALPVSTRSSPAVPAGGYPLYWHRTDGQFPNPSGYLFASEGSSRIGGNNAPASFNSVLPSNLWAGDSDSVLFSINQLRMAFATQHFVEAEARGGSRYTEVIRQHFGVMSPDARLQRPEYLGGNRIPINVNQVVQQSFDNNDQNLGDTGAFSMTSDVHDDFVHSFTEHGFLFGLCCVRYKHTYDTGINRMFLRRNRSDYYFPEFANISEQPVYAVEIDDSAPFSGIGNSASRVFGYQEAWAELRFKPSRVAGEMRPGIQNSLAFWHLGDYYAESAPTLGNLWIKEDKTNLDRCLAVSSNVSNQFFGDFYVKNYTTRAMPVYSVPGLDRM